jgi:hypothetical protein
MGVNRSVYTMAGDHLRRRSNQTAAAAATTSPAQAVHCTAAPSVSIPGRSQTPAAMMMSKITTANDGRRPRGAAGRAGAAGRSVGVPHRKHTIALSAISVPQERHFTATPVIDRHSPVKKPLRFVS